MELENILIEISSQFIDATIDNYDGRINQALKTLGACLRLDRCSFGHLTEDKKEMLVTHVWNKTKIPMTQERYHLKDHPWLLSPFRTGKPLFWHFSEGDPDATKLELKMLERSGMQTFAGVPVSVDLKLTCCLGFSRITCQDNWESEVVERFPLIASFFGQLIRRKNDDIELQNALKEVEILKEKLISENITLRSELKCHLGENAIVGESNAIKDNYYQAQYVAKENTTVLILGETGTGKELLAKAIHDMSPRSQNSMIKVNCAALPANLIESELFGREKGAYTGAMTYQKGRFEMAHGSTIFLDEIGDLPIDLQSKLLRVLQEGTFERLGSSKTTKVDVRVIAATNHNLEQAIKDGTFRKDLYYRLNVFPITVPPLRERREDIPMLVWAFVTRYNDSMGKSVTNINKESMEMLRQYVWPGNVRELKNIIERSMILTSSSLLNVIKLVAPDSEDEELHSSTDKLVDVERNHIQRVLTSTGWKVSGKNGAAEILGLKPTTLEARMKKLNIARPRP